MIHKTSEISYKTFEFDQTSVSYILFLLIIPGVYIYQTSIQEMEGKDQHIGKANRIYGILLPNANESVKMDLKGECSVQVKQAGEE